MGNLVGDKKAVNVTVPAGVYTHGDLYRIDQFSGFLINNVASADTDRKRVLEIAMNRSWEVKLPAAVTPARGDLLYWTAGAGVKRGDTDLTATVTGDPIVKVVTVKNAAGYAEVILASNRA
jgi:hypothetical protein